MKKNRSLLNRYILLVVLACILLPVTLYIAAVIFPYAIIYLMDALNLEAGRNVLNIVSLVTFLGVFTAFMIVSLLFFNRIRTRLVRLESAMELQEDTELEPVEISKNDEIGRLEIKFNQMVEQLRNSRQKEQEEERLRQELIANLSHDLRTPLTALRGQIYSLRKNHSDIQSTKTIDSADDKISYMGELIEQLLSYTLLSSEKYPYHPEHSELVRLMRRYFANWYDTLKADNFDIDILLPEEAVYATIDENLLRRMLDNVIQNVIRHASEGKYIGLELIPGEYRHTLKITDSGPGFEAADQKTEGAGIGLSILSMMTKMMEIEWEINTGHRGTSIIFFIDNEGTDSES